MSNTPTAAIGWQPVRYCIETDTMAVEIRPWPGREDDDGIARDAGVDLVIHYAPDGQAWLWEIGRRLTPPGTHRCRARRAAPAGCRRSLRAALIRWLSPTTFTHSRA